MSGWRRFWTEREGGLGLLKRVVHRRLDGRPVVILPYMGYGNASTFFVNGRVIRNIAIPKPNRDDRVWDNLRATYKRFEPDELANQAVTAEFRGQRHMVRSDREGYFRVNFKLNEPLQDPLAEVKLSLVDHPGDFKGFAMVPDPGAHFGVISDVDDTIVYSNAINKLDLALNTILNNAHTRNPFEGVPRKMQALAKGTLGHMLNPIFYVSNSPWNLYHLLTDFLYLNKIPAGPVMLRDFALEKDKFLGDKSHKRRAIANLLKTYPHLKFILIGDSGEKDPEIYRDVVASAPDRILAVYIREVTDHKREHQLKKIATNIRRYGVDMIVAKHSQCALTHARSKGWIP